MAASSKRVPIRRAHLGAPLLPVNSTGRYLRHRASADHAYRLRCRQLRLRRAALLIVAIILYFAIGRDLIAVARAKKDSAAMEIRHDTHQVATDLSRIAASARLASDQRIPGLDPVLRTGGQAAGPDDLDSLLSEQPIELQSRARQQPEASAF
ncbi:MAG: hypothetical protein ACE149_13235 [Armatimonadota bacterium]